MTDSLDTPSPEQLLADCEAGECRSFTWTIRRLGVGEEKLWSLHQRPMQTLASMLRRAGGLEVLVTDGQETWPVTSFLAWGAYLNRSAMFAEGVEPPVRFAAYGPQADEALQIVRRVLQDRGI